MDAQGALDSLLGRLTTILVEEAQLLGGIRGDVEVIKDEMESMNGLVLHLTEAQHRDHQVRAWMKQVVGLTRDCEGNVELYIHYVDGGPGGGGVLGYLRRVVRFLRTVPVRHRIAARIKELKVRARDIGDRRQRYGVTVPPWAEARSAPHDDDELTLTPWVAVGKEQDRWRRAVLLDSTAEPLRCEKILKKKCIDLLVNLLRREPALTAVAAGDGRDPWLRVSVLFVTHDSNCQHLDIYWVLESVLENSSVESSFDFQVYVVCSSTVGRTLADILEEVTDDRYWFAEEEEEVIATKLQEHFRGKRFLIVLQGGWLLWNQEEHLRSTLLGAADCTHGSAIILTQDTDEHVVVLPRPNEIQVMVGRHSVATWLTANKLTVDSPYCDRSLVLRLILLLHPDPFAAKMLLHLLYVNANRTTEELLNHYNTILECRRVNKSLAKQMLAFCYNELPTKYKNFLLYLTIFPKGHIIRAASLSRRWVAEGLIIARDDAESAADRSTKHWAAAMDEAEHYLDVLFTRGFLYQEEVSAVGNIKSFTVHDQVHQFIARSSKEVNFLHTNLPPQLAQHLSIHNRIGLQISHFDVNSKDIDIIVAFLPTLATSPQWQLLKVLDLEDCRGLKKHHLKSICKIFLLRYLSLRNTDIMELPKQIDKLQCLETLDIRQTSIRAFSTKSVKLPMLKYFLAGRTITPHNRSDMFEESFEGVRLPSGIRRMKKLEVMSHVEVSSNVNDLIDISQLLQLRKLGIVLHGTKGVLDLLFQQIEKLHGCLRSLSIRINQQTRNGSSPDAAEVVPALVNPPKFLESLSINGIKSGLPNWVTQLDQLMKVTLRETFLSEDAMHVLGKLRILRCLRLLHKSYTGRELNFREEEFQQLRSLVVKGEDITNISFDAGATTKLEMIIWSFGTMEALSLSGVDHLARLKKLELNGDCNLDPVKAAIEEHPNHPELRHNPDPRHQEDRTAVASPSSSAS